MPETAKEQAAESSDGILAEAALKQCQDSEVVVQLLTTLESSETSREAAVALRQALNEDRSEQRTHLTELRRRLQRAKQRARRWASENVALQLQLKDTEASTHSKLEATERLSNEVAQERDAIRNRLTELEERYSEEIGSKAPQKESDQEGKLSPEPNRSAAEAECIHASLAAAMNDLENSSGVGGKEAATGEDRRHMLNLEAMALSSREKQIRLTSELSEMRLQMLNMERGQNKGLRHQGSPPDNANANANNGGNATNVNNAYEDEPSHRHGNNRTKHPQRGPGNKLTSIEEEDDEENVIEESTVLSENTSVTTKEGDPCNPVSVEEFKALIKDLKTQLSEARGENQELKEEFAGREAEQASKVQRLTELLRASREESSSMQREPTGPLSGCVTPTAAHTTGGSAVAEDTERGSSLSATKGDDGEEPFAMESTSRDTASLEATKRELFLAREAKRIAGNRLEDMRQELEATRRRCDQHASELKTLKEQYASMEGKLSDPGITVQEVDQLRESISKATEEKNLMQHTLEWKEVQYKSKLEHLELEHHELKRRHRDELAQVKKQSEDALADCKRKMEAMESEKALSRSLGGASSSTSSADPAASGPLAWLAALRCPTRLEAGQSLSTSSLDAVHCREVGWQLLSIVPSTIALLCEVPGLKILDNTEGARMAWGESLGGSLVVSLLFSPQSAAWLRRAIVTHQNLAALDGSPGSVPGFAVHTLGQLEFRDAHGQPFEAAVTVAHLPAEVKPNSSAALVIVVVEPLAKRAKPSQSRGGRRSGVGGMPVGRAGSAVLSAAGGASVVSDDVLPSDSASNIAMRY
mmetsp:Transcript_14090/g.30591  ORF Transcript_14090/g.30591 Transcript_14090/m.30591 type:complete len:819 (-) Transcript_14090:50-2506(-)